VEEKSNKRDEIEKESEKIEVSLHKEENYDGGAATSTKHTP
jgi:hypothetical protein